MSTNQCKRCKSASMVLDYATDGKGAVLKCVSCGHEVNVHQLLARLRGLKEVAA